MVEMYPPNGGQVPAQVHDSQVDNMLAKGWVFEPIKPKRAPARPTPRTSATTRSTTDKPEQKQGTEEK